jgi:hypothetical protein
VGRIAFTAKGGGIGIDIEQTGIRIPSGTQVTCAGFLRQLRPNAVTVFGILIDGAICGSKAISSRDDLSWQEITGSRVVTVSGDVHTLKLRAITTIQNAGPMFDWDDVRVYPASEPCPPGAINQK